MHLHAGIGLGNRQRIQEKFQTDMFNIVLALINRLPPMGPEVPNPAVRHGLESTALQIDALFRIIHNLLQLSLRPLFHSFSITSFPPTPKTQIMDDTSTLSSERLNKPDLPSWIHSQDNTLSRDVGIMLQEAHRQHPSKHPTDHQHRMNNRPLVPTSRSCQILW